MQARHRSGHATVFCALLAVVAAALALPSATVAAGGPVARAPRPAAAAARGLAATVGDAALQWAAPVTVDAAKPYAGPNFLEDVSCVAGPLCVGVDASGNVVTSTAPTGGPTSWTVTAVGTSPLYGVSCPSTALCVAVGAGNDPRRQGSIAVSGNPGGGATAWTRIAVDGTKSMRAVSCPTVALCVALDDHGNIVASTNPLGGAAAWHVIPVQSIGDSLLAVACPAATLCVATDFSGDVYTSTSPAAAWQRSATLTGLQGVAHDLSCAASTCVIVSGTTVFASNNPTGTRTSWIASTTAPTFSGGTVACGPGPICLLPGYVGSNAGFAVSTNPMQPAANWTLITDGDSNGPATSASCLSTALCVAVDGGGGNVVTSTQPVGGAWKVAAADGSTPLTAISCPSTSLCVAVGGAGVLLTTTNPTGPRSAWVASSVDGTDTLTGVSCPTISLCVVVDDRGRVLTATNPAGGAAAWRAAAVTAPPVALTGVSCTAAPLCAVTDDASEVLTSTNPTGGAGAWTTTTVTGSGGGGGPPFGFTAISCTVAPLCVVTDHEGDIATSTNPTGGTSAWTLGYLGFSSTLRSVSCTVAATCVAVYDSGDVASTGNAASGAGGWSVAAPVSGGLTGLSGVHCTDAGLCVAVGGWELDTADPNGATWSTHSIDADNLQMLSVDCAGTAMCVATDEAGRVLVATQPFAASSVDPTVLAGAPVVNGAVATFTDDGVTQGATYSAQVNWGDGASSAGAVQRPAAHSQGWVVTASHDYLQPGIYSLTVTVTKAGSSATGTSYAVVPDTACVLPHPGLPPPRAGGISPTQLATNVRALFPALETNITQQAVTALDGDLSSLGVRAGSGTYTSGFFGAFGWTDTIRLERDFVKVVEFEHWTPTQALATLSKPLDTALGTFSTVWSSAQVTAFQQELNALHGHPTVDLANLMALGSFSTLFTEIGAAYALSDTQSGLGASVPFPQLMTGVGNGDPAVIVLDQVACNADGSATVLGLNGTAARLIHPPGFWGDPTIAGRLITAASSAAHTTASHLQNDLDQAWSALTAAEAQTGSVRQATGRATLLSMVAHPSFVDDAPPFSGGAPSPQGDASRYAETNADGSLNLPAVNATVAFDTQESAVLLAALIPGAASAPGGVLNQAWNVQLDTWSLQTGVLFGLSTLPMLKVPQNQACQFINQAQLANSAIQTFLSVVGFIPGVNLTSVPARAILGALTKIAGFLGSNTAWTSEAGNAQDVGELFWLGHVRAVMTYDLSTIGLIPPPASEDLSNYLSVVAASNDAAGTGIGDPTAANLTTEHLQTATSNMFRQWPPSGLHC